LQPEPFASDTFSMAPAEARRIEVPSAGVTGTGRLAAHFAGALAALALLAGQASAGGLPRTPPQAAQHLLELLKAGKTSGASRLFFVPKHYDADKARAERQGLAGSIAALTEQFGALGDFQPHLGEYHAMMVSLVPGSADEIESGAFPSESMRVTYRARFAREGECYVSVELVPDGSRWMVRALHYGLDVNRPDAEQRMQTILRHLSDHAAAPSAPDAS